MRTALALVLSAAAWAQPPAPAPMVAPPPLRAAAALITDYGNLARYAADNQQVPAPAAGEERVVFMGDSITDGWGRNVKVPFFPGKAIYQSRHQRADHRADAAPLLSRRSGAQTQGRRLSWQAPTISAAISARSRWNPSRQPGRHVRYRARQRIKVVLASLTPVCDYHRPQTVQRPPEKIKALNQWIKDYLRAQPLRLSRLLHRYGGRQGLLQDRNHR